MLLPIVNNFSYSKALFICLLWLVSIAVSADNKGGSTDNKIFDKVPTELLADKPLADKLHPSEQPLTKLLSPIQAKFLPPEQVFKIYAKIQANKTNKADKPELELTWQILPGYYLFRDSIKIMDLNNQQLINLSTKLPPAILIADEIVGDYYVFTEIVTLKLPLEINEKFEFNELPKSIQAVDVTTTKNKPLKFLITYQGCAIDGICYPPFYKQLLIADSTNITIIDYPGNPHELLTSSVTVQPTQATQPKQSTQPTQISQSSAVITSQTDQALKYLTSATLTVIISVFFIFGLLLTFTPCGWPMLPLILNLIIGATKANYRAKSAVILVSLYVLSMSLCYAIAGVAAGYLGSTIQAALQTPLVLIFIASILILLALMQFDWLPAISTQFLLNRFSLFNTKYSLYSAPGMLTAIILGAMGALVISPCVTPAFIGVLIYITKYGDPWLGGVALFALGLGMGAPLIVLALLGGVMLPKAGLWLKMVKYLTGIALLGLAVWLLLRIPAVQTMVNFISSDAMTSSSPSSVVVSSKLKFKNIRTVTELNAALATAKQEGKPVFIKYYASWCVTCNKNERIIASSTELQAALQAFTLLHVDVTENSAANRELLQAFQVFSPPALIFIAADGTERSNYRLVSFLNANEFIVHIDNFLKNDRG